jgi:polyphosphate kinase 2
VANDAAAAKKRSTRKPAERVITIDDMERHRAYEESVPKKEYERTLEALQVELLKMQRWVIDEGERIVIVFEGRDAAGKGGAIRRFMEHMNPRHARIAALPKPSDVERTQWYFQRYVAHLPSAGEIVLFDRSWYNRAGVERVMGFCTRRQYEQFFHQVPEFEDALVESGIRLFKLWFTVSQAEQAARFEERRDDPLKQWKLSPMDVEAQARYAQYGKARDAMLEQTHREHAPWTVINSNEQKRARLEAIRHVLSSVPYRHKDRSVVGRPDPLVVGDAAALLAARARARSR